MSNIPNVKMDIRTMSNGEIEALFTESYEEGIAYDNNIVEFEANCERASGSRKATMLVNIVGFAGSPTLDEYNKGKVNELEISREDKGKLKFTLNPSMTTPLGGIDYQAVYESE